MAKAAKNHLRIIGGTWRGRKIPFADSVGLRPTGDRIRETLFNWLQNDIAGSHCLDLFAGSGALGFEAASRGAESVTMIEKEAKVVAVLSEQIARLQARTIAVKQTSAERFLDELSATENTANQRFDIVFIDPPFDAQLQVPILHKLVSSDVLSSGAVVYVESAKASRESTTLENEIPIDRLVELRSKQTGNVAYQLFQVG